MEKNTVKLAYLGFSNVNSNLHRSATSAGIAQSDYTHTLLNTIFETNYYVAVSTRDYKIPFDSKIPILIRNRLALRMYDCLNILCKINFKKFNKIILYHSLLFLPLVFYFYILRIKFVLQVNEIYSLSGTHSSFFSRILEGFMFSTADSYIISSNSLVPILAKYKKSNPKIISVISGPLIIREDVSFSKICNDSRPQSCRLVYAGIVDKVKNGGAFIAVKLANLLNSDNFTLDIYGFGENSCIDELKKIIVCNNSLSMTKVNYIGNLSQELLVNKLQNYDIGLATQYIGTSFSSTSFPSKILTYMCAGLNVICATSQPVNSWKYKDIINIYFDDDLTDLVNILMNMKIKSKAQVSERLKDIHREILKDLRANLV